MRMEYELRKCYNFFHCNWWYMSYILRLCLVFMADQGLAQQGDNNGTLW